MFDGFWHVRPQFMERILTRRQIWCDDVRTRPVETCAELATDALDAALLDLPAGSATIRPPGAGVMPMSPA